MLVFSLLIKPYICVGYNGKKIGYDVTMSESSGMSMEIITQWRNVKVTWNRQGDMSGNMEGTLGLYWDSSRDLTKRFLGTSKVEKTAENTYKWTTTVSHPYLVKVSSRGVLGLIENFFVCTLYII